MGNNIYNEEPEYRSECENCKYWEDDMCMQGVCIYKTKDIALFDDEEERRSIHISTDSYNKKRDAGERKKIIMRKW